MSYNKENQIINNSSNFSDSDLDKINSAIQERTVSKFSEYIKSLVDNSSGIEKVLSSSDGYLSTISTGNNILSSYFTSEQWNNTISSISYNVEVTSSILKDIYIDNKSLGINRSNSLVKLGEVLATYTSSTSSYLSNISKNVEDISDDSDDFGTSDLSGKKEESNSELGKYIGSQVGNVIEGSFRELSGINLNMSGFLSKLTSAFTAAGPIGVIISLLTAIANIAVDDISKGISEWKKFDSQIPTLVKSHYDDIYSVITRGDDNYKKLLNYYLADSKLNLSIVEGIKAGQVKDINDIKDLIRENIKELGYQRQTYSEFISALHNNYITLTQAGYLESDSRRLNRLLSDTGTGPYDIGWSTRIGVGANDELVKATTRFYGNYESVLTPIFERIERTSASFFATTSSLIRTTNTVTSGLRAYTQNSEEFKNRMQDVINAAGKLEDNMLSSSALFSKLDDFLGSTMGTSMSSQFAATLATYGIDPAMAWMNPGESMSTLVPTLLDNVRNTLGDLSLMDRSTAYQLIENTGLNKLGYSSNDIYNYLTEGINLPEREESALDVSRGIRSEMEKIANWVDQKALDKVYIDAKTQKDSLMRMRYMDTTDFYYKVFDTNQKALLLVEEAIADALGAVHDDKVINDSIVLRYIDRHKFIKDYLPKVDKGLSEYFYSPEQTWDEVWRRKDELNLDSDKSGSVTFKEMTEAFKKLAEEQTKNGIIQYNVSEEFRAAAMEYAESTRNNTKALEENTRATNNNTFGEDSLYDPTSGSTYKYLDPMYTKTLPKGYDIFSTVE